MLMRQRDGYSGAEGRHWLRRFIGPPPSLISTRAHRVLTALGVMAFAITGFGGDQYSPSWLRGAFFAYPSMLLLWLVVMLLVLQWVMVGKLVSASGSSTPWKSQVFAVGVSFLIIALVVVLALLGTDLVTLIQHASNAHGRAQLGHWIVFIFHVVLLCGFAGGGVNGILSLRRMRRSKSEPELENDAIIGLFAGGLFLLIVAFFSALTSALVASTNPSAVFFQAVTHAPSSSRDASSCILSILTCEQHPDAPGWLNWIICDVILAVVCIVVGTMLLADETLREGFRTGTLGQGEEVGGIFKRFLSVPLRVARKMFKSLRHVFWPICVCAALVVAAIGAYFTQVYLQVLRSQEEAASWLDLWHWMGTLKSAPIDLVLAVVCTVLPFFILAVAVALQLWRSTGDFGANITYWASSLTRIEWILFLPFFLLSLALAGINIGWMFMAHVISGGAVPQPFWPFGISTALALVGFYIAHWLNRGARKKSSGAAR